MTTTPYQLRAIGDSAVRNLIINGNMDFWQRGTSVSLTTSNLYQADRFASARSATWTGTYAQSSNVPTQTQSDFQSRFSLLITNGTGAAASSGDVYYVEHDLEGQDYQLLHSKRCRLQFWVKSSVTGTFSVSLGNSARDRTYIATYTIVAANTWERKTIDVTADTTGTWLFDNTVGFRVRWTLSAGTTFQTATVGSWGAGNFYSSNASTNWAGTTGATFQLAQVALYPGNFGPALVIPFQRVGRTVGHELQMCQRFYEKNYDITTAPGTSTSNNNHFITCRVDSAGQAFFPVVFKVSKRTTPTITLYNDNTGTSGQWRTAFTTAAYSAGSTTTVTNQGENMFCGLNVGNTAGQIAEAIAMWVADSEL